MFARIRHARSPRRPVFRPSADALECRDVKASGAMGFAFGGIAEVVGSGNGDTVRISQAAAAITVDVKNAVGEDVFTFPASDSLIVLGGAGANDIDSTGTGSEFLIGGAGDNVIRGGSGTTEILVPGSGHNTLYAGGGHTDMVVQSSGQTELFGGGAYTSYTLNAGTNLVHADAQQNVVTSSRWATRNTIVADASAPLDVYEYDNPNDTIEGNGNTTVHKLTI